MKPLISTKEVERDLIKILSYHLSEIESDDIFIECNKQVIKGLINFLKSKGFEYESTFLHKDLDVRASIKEPFLMGYKDDFVHLLIEIKGIQMTDGQKLYIFQKVSDLKGMIPE